ncbi:MAG: asmA family protein, partial [Hyphomicrobiales bacterium]
MLPVGWLKDDAEQALSKHVGAPVTIATIERENAFSFAPVIRAARIAIPQPKWAGPGMLATVQDLRVRVNVFALLFGKAKPQLLSASGVTLNLVRDADQRVNWRTGPQSPGADGPNLADLQKIDGIVDYRDAFQQRAFRVSFRLDPDRGLSAQGRGDVAGNAVAIRAKAAAPRSGNWPFDLSLKGDALTIQIDGAMAEPFDAARMKFKTKARANDLKLIDRVIEAGLFGTQPVDLAAQVERDGERWNISSLSGTIGSSDIDGKATIVKSGTGATLDASIRSRQLDFEDLASDEGNASARALEQSLGLKAVPNTRVNIEKIAL